MNIFEKHEQFEIEVLNLLKSNFLLQPLVFGGGTMLRLCYNLQRYSADLDFWFIKKTNHDSFFKKMETVVERNYILTDAQKKYHTLLFEVKSTNYPRRLKIEIRKMMSDCEYQERIAYSVFSDFQVVLRTHTLEQTMTNKIEALLERNEIRDAFDIEFLLMKGIALPELSAKQRAAIQSRLDGYRTNDFKVKLGSVLTAEKRSYYIKHGFNLLKEKLLD